MTIVDRMKEYLPRYYEESRHMNSIMETESAEVEALTLDIKDVLDQMFIETATWGLDLWEKEFGIKKSATDTDTTRRSRLKALVRGGVTLTPERLQEVVLAYVNVCSITYSDATYSFTVTILDPLGIPELDKNLQAAVEELRPAHLAFTIAYTYNTWTVFGTQTWTVAGGSSTWYELATRQ